MPKINPTPPLWCVKSDGETHWILAENTDSHNDGALYMFNPNTSGTSLCTGVAYFAHGHWESVIRCSARGYPTDESYPLEPGAAKTERFTTASGTEVVKTTGSCPGPANVMIQYELTTPAGQKDKDPAKKTTNVQKTTEQEPNEESAANTEAAAIGESLEPDVGPTITVGPGLSGFVRLDDGPVADVPPPRHSREKLDAVAEMVRAGSSPTKEEYGKGLGHLVPEPTGEEMAKNLRDMAACLPVGDEDAEKLESAAKNVENVPFPISGLEVGVGHKPPEGPAKPRKDPGVVDHWDIHLRRARDLSEAMGMVKWRKLTDGRKAMLVKRMEAERDTFMKEITLRSGVDGFNDRANAFWDHVVETLSGIQVDSSWMNLECLLRVPQRSDKIDHFQRASEGSYRDTPQGQGKDEDEDDTSF